VSTTEIYILRHGKSAGPYNIGAIRAFLANGSLSPQDMAWHEGLAGWVPVSSLAVISQPHQTKKVVLRQKLTVAKNPSKTNPIPKLVETRVARVREQQTEMYEHIEGRHRHWAWLGPLIAGLAVFFLLAMFIYFKWVRKWL
jgi:hypothetical protein